jgi:hypothetical protein
MAQEQRSFTLSEAEIDEVPRFTIDGEINRRYERFNAVGRQLTVSLLPPIEGEDSNPISHFLTSVTDLFDYALRDCDDSDMVGITISNEVNVQDKAIGISFRRKDQINSDVIWSVFAKVAQSNARFNALDRLVVTVHSVKMPIGNGLGIKAKGRQLETMVRLKRSIIEVKAAENCLAHALIISIARVTNDPNYKSYRMGNKIRPVVDRLLETTGIDLSDGGGLPELVRFQEHFKEYRIVVFAGLNCDEIMFDGNVKTEKRINLLYDDVSKHYHVIGNLTGALSRRYVCKGCNKGCERGVTHKCKEICSDCMSVPPCAYTDVRIPCEGCNRQFRSRTCFNKHKTNKLEGKTVCEKKRNCVVCNKLVTSENHECFKPFCRNCNQNKEVNHLCYMQRLSNKLPRSSDVLFVFYDFETTQDTKFSDDATEHVPILVCLQQFCSVCETIEDIDTDCKRCGRRRHSFFEDPVGDMLTYLTQPRPWCKQVVAIAHNAKAFDAHFILKRAIFQKWNPELILNGLKILSMQIEHIHFLDSVNYLPMPLRKLPEAFGLTASKSWYPHYFNTKANLDYVGPIPDIRYYGADEMGEGERRDFLSWYRERKDADEVFDNRYVLEQYCQDDVTVLRQACQIFRREFMKIGNIEVFLEAVTIASACNKVLRKKFLKPGTVGLIPSGGYSANHRYSKKALKWLLHMERMDECQIRHARNGREFKPPELPHYSVDGYCAETRTVYEFLGCYYHGCTCQPFRDVKMLSDETLAERYEQTLARIQQIKRAGYRVKCMWECQFDESQIAPELLAHPIVRHEPLITRDALYGGRTEAMRLHYKIRDGVESVQYCDVMSLYPYICKYFKFPIGHPVIHIGDTCADKEACLRMNGLMKCTVVPPKDLYHPVLPYRYNKKLLFCLCRSCVFEKNAKDECHHFSDAERCLQGTWVIDEVRLAIEKGYRILEIHEVYEYAVTQYDPNTGEGGLFVEYIDTFLKLKAEASGYPSWVRTSEDEETYIRQFYQTEGIQLDRDSIGYNAAKRGLSKLCLNSMWGKLTERSNRTQTRLFSSPQELYRFLVMPGIEVQNMVFASDYVVWIAWRYADEELVPSLRHTNEVIGAYVTAGARIHLYSFLDRLQDKAIYTDTDSVIYVQPSDEPTLVETGDNLGQMTSELKPHEIITEVVCAGPKNYAYKTFDSSTGASKTVCKVRGITLNYSASKLINFEKIRDMILNANEDETVIVRTKNKIKRKRGSGGVNIISQPEEKTYRVSFLKRRRLSDNTSLPFGYISGD